MKARVNISFGIPIWLDKICTWPVMFYRKQKYGYSFRRIYLGQSQWTILDVEDYYKFANIGWALSGCQRNLYAIGSIKNKNGEFELVRLHRAIMNPPYKRIVDHRNWDGLDNRRENLRIATKSQNAFNCRKRKNTTSQFYGVYFRKSTGKWVACVWYRKKRISLGNFQNEIEAARAYDRAAIKYRKEFARLNFPEGLLWPECPGNLLAGERGRRTNPLSLLALSAVEGLDS